MSARTTTLIGILFLTTPGGVSLAGDKLPESATYLLYIEGVERGRSEFPLQRAGTLIRIDSPTVVSYTNFDMNYRSVTTADPETFAVRSFEYRGKMNGNETAAGVDVDGRIVTGWTEKDGIQYPATR